jgi:UDP-2-acetamido-2-deoxy-ribo-hexuluronate aminotransferase
MSIVSMYDPTRHFNENKINYMEKINKVLSHGCFINGPEIKEIEEKLLKYVNVKHSIAVSSGTDALLIALMAVGVTNLDEVVTVPFTWISTAEVIKLLGLKPVFCDVDKDTFNMDPLSLQNVITEKTKVVMPVSIFGQIYEVEKIKKIVNNAEIKYNKKIYIIEDAAQSFGSIDELGRKSCSVGDIGCTSFFPSKPLGCFGDGGMCFTNNDELANKMKMIRNHGCIERYKYKCVGINGRLDTIQAAILLAKFEDFENSLNKRIINAKKYNIAFLKFPFQTPVVSKNCSKHVYAQYTIKLNDEKTRDDLLKYLNTNNIGNGIFYPVCLHLVDIITKDYKEESLPIAEKLAKRVLSIPVYSELTDTEIDFVIYNINNFFFRNI